VGARAGPDAARAKVPRSSRRGTSRTRRRLLPFARCYSDGVRAPSLSNLAPRLRRAYAGRSLGRAAYRFCRSSRAGVSYRPVKTPAYQRSSWRLAPRLVPAAARIRSSERRPGARVARPRLPVSLTRSGLEPLSQRAGASPLRSLCRACAVLALCLAAAGLGADASGSTCDWGRIAGGPRSVWRVRWCASGEVAPLRLRVVDAKRCRRRWRRAGRDDEGRFDDGSSGSGVLGQSGRVR
jgi:hypothetical protein